MWSSIHFTKRLNEAGFRYLVTGSMAAAIYGEPRNTNGVDLILLLPSAQARKLAALFPLEQFYCPPVEVLEIEANREANGHFNLIHHETGFKADVYLMGNDPLHGWAFRNRRKAEIDGEEIAIAPAEYVIIRKLDFYRSGESPKHLSDIRMMLAVSRDLINVPELEEMIREQGLTKYWEMMNDD